MSKKKKSLQNGIELREDCLFLSGKINKNTVSALWNYHIGNLSKIKAVDISDITELDSAGAIFIEDLTKRIQDQNSSLADTKIEDLITGKNEDYQETMRIFTQKHLQTVPAKTFIGYFEALADSFFFYIAAFYEAMVLSADIFYWSIAGIWKKRGDRKGAFTQQCILFGVEAVPIVLLLSFIIGLILSLQSAVQLRMFGANIYIADLISISMLKEMGPMMTAIIVAGRSGSAIASEIATMKVSEELDALKMMAMNPIRYVVIPKFYAMTICLPLLVVISIIVGILGGVIVAVTYLNISVTAFYNQMVNALQLKDLFLSLLKSTIFAWAIVIIGSFYGFRVQGGAEGVGKATTLSVVASIFAVIVIDVIFSLLYLPK